ncbi:aspartate carbamoyltransferase catalytic subunit [candidate division NPL-UPA2 bacterium]|nr:aspartate carbamoyltransferase catalytic subunit [candidate division NPL-UPA2 bacterium]
MKWKRKDLLGLEELSAREIKFILDTAESFKEISLRPIRKVPTLRGKTIINLFLEPSTRTRTSFELAAKRLSADTVNISASTSSVVKGETLKDMARNIEAMKVDVIIMRHSLPGAPHFLARVVSPSLINAGDGAHEHPTQGLLDLFTIREKKGRLKGLKVVIIGDIAHSRVARSNIWGLIKLGAEVAVVGPATLIPPGIERMGVKVYYRVEEAIRKADVINVLRIQLERQRGGLFPSLREYRQLFSINRERLKVACPHTLIMHPGPINRGVELDPDVADGPYSVILDQVTNGLAVRMAVLYLLAGGKE